MEQELSKVGIGITRHRRAQWRGRVGEESGRGAKISQIKYALKPHMETYLFVSKLKNNSS